MSEFHIHHLSEKGLEIVRRWPTYYLDPYPGGYVEQYIQAGRLKEEDAVNLRYGFEFEDDWLPFADELGEFATAIQRAAINEGYPDARIASCILKSKFGSLEEQGDYNLPRPWNTIWARLCNDISTRSRIARQNTAKNE